MYLAIIIKILLNTHFLRHVLQRFGGVVRIHMTQRMMKKSIKMKPTA